MKGIRDSDRDKKQGHDDIPVIIRAKSMLQTQGGSQRLDTRGKCGLKRKVADKTALKLSPEPERHLGHIRKTLEAA